MDTRAKCIPAFLILVIGSILATSTMSGTEPLSLIEANKRMIQVSFDRWRAGTGGPFELLAEDSTWTIAGNSTVARKYESRNEFLDTVIKPFNARLTKPLSPTLRSLYGDGDTVVALFDGEATALDGKPYRNTYAWFMKLRNGKITNVTAFFDSIAFDEFWKRVPVNQ